MPAPTGNAPNRTEQIGAGSGWPGRRGSWAFFGLIGLVFLWICTDGTWRPWARQDFGDIYDHLAISLVDGRLDLPAEVIGGEAFVVEGKYYGYWAPFPALLRVPLVLTGRTYWVGHTARLMCWLAAMLSVYAAGRIVGELQTLYGWPCRRAGFWWCYWAALALGTHLPYLLAGTSVYHEAVLWGTATALGALQLGLGFLNTRRWIQLVGAVLLAGASASTRATTGYGALIGTTGLVGLYWWNNRRGRSGVTGRSVGGRVLLLAGLTVVMGLLPLGYNYVRFGSFVRLPYEKHPNIEPWRLEITRHGNFQAVNLVPNARSYFDPSQLDVRPGFPYFHLAAYQPKPGSRLEHAEAYAGIPAFMTGLCVLAVLGLYGIRRDRQVGLLLVGGGATLLSLLAFTAIAHRYEHDLFPLLVLLSGTGALWLGQRQGPLPALAQALMALLLVVGIWQSLSFAHFELKWARAWSAQNSPRIDATPVTGPGGRP